MRYGTQAVFMLLSPFLYVYNVSNFCKACAASFWLLTQALQEDIKEHQDQLSDLTVECERVGELESLPQAENLRAQVAILQSATMQLKLDALQRHRDLKQALRDSERRTRELQEYKQRVENLQQWIAETKRIAESPPRAREATERLAAEQKDLQDKLGADLTDHQQLLRSVNEQAQKVLETLPPGGIAQEAADSPEGITANWRQLSRQLSERKLQLQDMVDLNKPRELGEPVAYYHPGVMGYKPDTASRMAEAKRSLSELTKCWEMLQGQVEDKQTRLERTLHFQQLYQDAMSNVSAWLDAVEQRIFASPTDKDMEERLHNNKVRKTLATSSLLRSKFLLCSAKLRFFASTGTAGGDAGPAVRDLPDEPGLPAADVRGIP